jgi:hypothetical protein
MSEKARELRKAELRSLLIRDLASEKLFSKLNPLNKDMSSPESGLFYSNRAGGYAEEIEELENEQDS